MKLEKFEYKELIGQPNEWTLHEFELEKINLIVAKNSTGKTKTIESIRNLCRLVSGVDLPVGNSVSFNAFLRENSDTFTYSLNIDKEKVLYECLNKNNEEMFYRKNGDNAEILYFNEGKKIEFQPPDNQLVITRRDSLQHPYMEPLFYWANNMRFFAFGEKMGKDTGLQPKDLRNNDILFDRNDTTQVTAFYALGKNKFGDDFSKAIITNLANIGFDISELGIAMNTIYSSGGSSALFMIYIIEKSGTERLFQPAISQGLFRSLSLLIQLQYAIMSGEKILLLIDDIGEGLDFDRASKLIKLLIDLTIANDIQLVMSTNDRYVMNGVPLEYWQIIDRNDGECKVHNYRNSKTKFDEFAYMGLSNFDFLKYDYINSTWESIKL